MNNPVASSKTIKASILLAALGYFVEIYDLILFSIVRIKSLSIRKMGVEFFGAGSGHGVGLCQWGARLQAEKGRNYDKILHFYFPGAVLSEIDE